MGIEKIQNFSFQFDVELEKEKYIKQHGKDEYYKFNVLNMFEIMKERSLEYQIGYNIPISKVLSNSIDNIVSDLIDYTGVDIDIQNANLIHNRWKNLHNPIDQVYNCIWFEKIFKNKNYAQIN